MIQDYNAKLSDFGLAKDGPEGDKTHVSTRVMGTYGYAAPEYVMTGKLPCGTVSPLCTMFLTFVCYLYFFTSGGRFRFRILNYLVVRSFPYSCSCCILIMSITYKTCSSIMFC